jgi:hypothetical protein
MRRREGDLLRAFLGVAERGGHHVDAAKCQFGNTLLKGDTLVVKLELHPLGNTSADVDVKPDDFSRLGVLEAEWFDVGQGAANQGAARLYVGELVGHGGQRRHGDQRESGQSHAAGAVFHRVLLLYGGKGWDRNGCNVRPQDRRRRQPRVWHPPG